jgi:hypothetical protein
MARCWHWVTVLGNRAAGAMPGGQEEKGRLNRLSILLATSTQLI